MEKITTYIGYSFFLIQINTKAFLGSIRDTFAHNYQISTPWKIEAPGLTWKNM